MWKRCAYLVLLITILALIPGGVSRGAFDAKKDPALVGYWSFDEGKGTVAADSSPFKRNGTLQGGATWAPGRFGTGIQLNGTDAYVAVPNFQLTTDKITMVAWVKGWKAADWAAIITGQPTRLELGFGDNDTLHYTWNNDNSATWNWRGGPVIPQDSWTLVAATIDPTKAVAYVYTDQGGLKQGTNTMAHISQTFTQLEIGFSFSPRYVRGTIDEVAVYSRALTEAEILALTKGPRPPGAADAPSPPDKAIDVPQDASLAWAAGPYPGTHDVYLGTAFADVNTASRTDKKNVLASQGQADASFDPPGMLAFGQTYYWRIDEVNKSADGTIFKGDVWSFTVEPYGYPVKPAKATASSAQAGMGPENTINGAGLTGDLHGVEPTTMWMSAGVKPNWIQYEFDKAYKLNDLQVWNSNQLIESLLGFGAKTVTIETSLDGTTWTPLANVPEFGRGPGAADYAANTTVNFGGVEAKFVKLTINASWGGLAPQTGLAEVRFTYVPVQAFGPQPASAASGVSVDTTLNWRPGRGAASHKILFGADANAVANGTVAAKTVTNHSFAPDSLNLATTYYWRVDEVNAAVTYPGTVWSFTTATFKVVDDFESYTDKAGEEVFSIWIDGFADNYKSSGSTVGLDTAVGGTYCETTIIHGGRQAMPLRYDNSKAPISEAVRTFDKPQDWTASGVKSLSLWFQGTAGNGGQLYVKINGTKVPYDGAAGNLAKSLWIPWNIDLSKVAGNLSKVTSLTMGIEGAGAKGTLYIDDIRLYPKTPEYYTPADPGKTNLKALYTFEGNVNDMSGNGLNGTLKLGTLVASGRPEGGSALKVDKAGYVDLGNPPSLDFGTGDWTVTAWFKTAMKGTGDTNQGTIYAKGGDSTAGKRYVLIMSQNTEGVVTLVCDDDVTRYDANSKTLTNDDQWHFVAGQREGRTIRIFIDGQVEGTTTLPAGYNLAGTSQRNAYIGASTYQPDGHLYKFFGGLIDDVRLYDRALSVGEIMWLAGQSTSAAKPF